MALILTGVLPLPPPAWPPQLFRAQDLTPTRIIKRTARAAETLSRRKAIGMAMALILTCVLPPPPPACPPPACPQPAWPPPLECEMITQHRHFCHPSLWQFQA